MGRKQIIEHQFDKLLAEADRIAADQPNISSLGYNSSDPTATQFYKRLERFSVQAQHLVESVCEQGSVHNKRLTELTLMSGVLGEFPIDRFSGVLQAAQSDFKDGMFDNIRRLVRADVLDDFLSQAEELLSSGFSEASVSLGGAILEDTLRKLCDKQAPPIIYAKKTSIEALNVSLARESVYNLLVQKTITAFAQLRNDADHGRSLGTVKAADAEGMLKWVRRFVTDYLN
jgi:hypothetical protein